MRSDWNTGFNIHERDALIDISGVWFCPHRLDLSWNELKTTTLHNRIGVYSIFWVQTNWDSLTQHNTESWHAEMSSDLTWHWHHEWRGWTSAGGWDESEAWYVGMCSYDIVKLGPAERTALPEASHCAVALVWWEERWQQRPGELCRREPTWLRPSSPPASWWSSREAPPMI